MEPLTSGRSSFALTAAGAAAPTIIPPLAYCRIEHFLAPEQLECLQEEILSREHEFVASETTTGQPDYRESLVLHTAMQVLPEFAELVGACMPLLRQVFALDGEAFSMEKQITAHNDGNFFKVHNDSGIAPRNSRLLTYVYYFHREPKAFEGGELILYDAVLRGVVPEVVGSYHVIPPEQNSIVFFRSSEHHEVRPVRVPSRRFADCRFTVNGWIHAGNADETGGASE